MNYLIIGNWKMYLTYAQAVAWAHLNKQELHSLARATNNELVLCPSFDALSDISKIIKTTGIALGAQDCAAHEHGAYTGQVSAKSLKEVGCSYCIVGHSEARHYQQLDNQTVAQKMVQVRKAGLTPIVCVGEHKDAYEAKETFHIIAEQLAPVLLGYKNSPAHEDPLVIAYEPIWAIGTEVTPDNEYLKAVYQFILSTCQEAGLQRTPLLLYGGSVSSENIQTLAKVKEIQGFLIGGASINFQKFKKIVELI